MPREQRDGHSSDRRAGPARPSAKAGLVSRQIVKELLARAVAIHAHDREATISVLIFNLYSGDRLPFPALSSVAGPGHRGPAVGELLASLLAKQPRVKCLDFTFCEVVFVVERANRTLVTTLFHTLQVATQVPVDPPRQTNIEGRLAGKPFAISAGA